MEKIAATMPEARFRSTKRRAHPVRSTVASHRNHAGAAAAGSSSAAIAAAASLPMDAVTAPAVLAAEAPQVKTAQVKTAQVKTAQPKPAQKKGKRRGLGEAIASWWPVAVGIFLSGFAPEWHEMAVQGGIWALRAAFPLALFATHREIGIDDQMAAMLPDAALFLQLPLEGLLTKLTLDRGKSLKSAMAQLLLLHGVAVLVLWLITFAPK